MPDVITFSQKFTPDVGGLYASVASRQVVISSLRLKHTYLVGQLPLGFSQPWWSFLEDRGITSYKHSLLDKSDMARDRLSVCVDDLSKDDYVHIELYNGYVLWTLDGLGYLRYYSSKLLFDVALATGFYHIYDSKGAVVAEGSDELAVLLEELSIYSLDSFYFSDNQEEYPLVIKRFFQNTGRVLHHVIHYNLLDPQMTFTYPHWARLVASSEVLVERLASLGIGSSFIPPIFVNPRSEVNTYNCVDDFCIVGSHPFKRMADVIRYFGEYHPYKSLTVYGCSGKFKKELGELASGYPNVVIKGIVSRVPYEYHKAYISYSPSECFANSAVEASSYGLVLYLSNVGLAHRYYTSLDSSIVLFDRLEDLKESDFKNQRSSIITKAYGLKQIQNAYKQLLGLSYC